MNLAHFISGRLRSAGGANPAAVLIAVAGVALSLMVMEFTLAIVIGFKDGIRAKLSGFDAQVSVLAPAVAGGSSAPEFVDMSPALQAAVGSALPPEAETRLSMRRPGMIKTDTDFQGIVFIGQSPDADFSFEKSNIVAGRWPDYSADSCENHIVISEPLASTLGLGLGDKVYSTFIVDGVVKVRRHTIAGLFRSNFGEYDRTVAYASLAGLQKVFGADSLSADRLDIRGIADDDIDAVASNLHQALMAEAASGALPYYPVDDIKHSGALYFNWLALLDTNVTVIFILMLAVAGFTLVSSLFILILEQVPMIGVLRTLGASRRLVGNIFIDLGLRLTGMGMLIGNTLGIGLLLTQQCTNAIPLDPEMYYLSAVPVHIVPWAFVVLNIGVAAVSFLILIIPARMAARTDPAKAMASE
ncbi:MAG: ABC transporter permease [Muribaculaceae bacterium]|nr:ABC transporter permease [Muribaculaceae bacterium]